MAVDGRILTDAFPESSAASSNVHSRASAARRKIALGWKACGCASGTPTGSGWKSGWPTGGRCWRTRSCGPGRPAAGVGIMWWAAWKYCGRGQLLHWGAS